MDDESQRVLTRANKLLIMEQLLGFKFKLVKSVIGSLQIFYNNGQYALDYLEDDAHVVSIYDNNKDIEQFRKFFGKNEGLIYVTQVEPSDGVAGFCTIIATCIYAFSKNRKKHSTTKTSMRKKRRV